VTLPFWISDAVLIGSQAAVIALPRAAPPPALQRLMRRGWALVPALSIAGVVTVLAVAPGTATFLTYLALVATPVLAAAALGYIVHGARPAAALAVIPLLAVAWAAKSSLAGEAAALALTALGCLTLGWLLASVTPVNWLKAGIVVAAVVDSILVFSTLLSEPNATLNAAAPAAGLPQLQFVSFGSGSMGYGDYFIAGVLGGLLLREGRRTLPVAAACLVFAACFDLLFFVTDLLPATVPVALALIASELAARRRARTDAGLRSVASDSGSVPGRAGVTVIP
jgi:hypothetical protein